jgi:hypothetical protein
VKKLFKLNPSILNEGERIKAKIKIEGKKTLEGLTQRGNSEINYFFNQK